ncbi:hypothetical protein [Marilutibacter maris]|uniref:hypothetical protein n=1 Tax=Marilutibacter maris TaxID=1605891 RepID=UPI000DA85138|nr:hypothetical protein [Lysobacter maris]
MIGRFAASLLLCGLPLGAASASDVLGDCGGAPEGAVTTLPAPVSEWGVLACSPETGHMLAARPGWAWKFVDTMKDFGLPANFGQDDGQAPAAYFVAARINDAPLEHPLTLNAAKALSEGLAAEPDPWDSARVLSLGNTRQQGVRVFVFEKTDEHAGPMRWAIMCNWDASQCSPGHRFMILDLRDRQAGH